ncbi:carbonic anhydrase [Motilimonas eburnea]|uniref:carbonic anhydrase n=1 Tax=Motilimonas eburnea TaxID=1737488 RepID=UPI001E541F7F|nr:carbonic anhydrase family protein [Motilimonas eburnea]MCE2573641.1 carbonic anhydrase family protein [Motilimonas eburnea]
MTKVFWFAALVLLIDIFDIAFSPAPAPVSPTAKAAAASNDHNWSYRGDTGPKFWGEISRTCQQGQQQSPIDILDATPARLDDIEWDYEHKLQNIVNNGHTVQINLQPGSEIEFQDRDYQLKQVHFHTPSENHVKGKSYPFEAHLVHSNKAGELAVVAVFFEQGEANPALTSLWQAMPMHPGEKVSLKKVQIDLNDLLPKQRSYYHFLGSLTTPPCSEGVKWLVMQQPITASEQQIAAFKLALPSANNRPIQALNDRPISRSK